jgi:hypothetical protein
MKEQISLRIDPEVKKLMEEMASKEIRSLGNVAEKLILERLRDMGLLDEHFQTIKKKA